MKLIYLAVHFSQCHFSFQFYGTQLVPSSGMRGKFTFLAHLQYPPQTSKYFLGPRLIFSCLLSLIEMGWFFSFWIFDFDKMGFFSLSEYFLDFINRGFYLFCSFVGDSNLVYPKIIAFQSSGCLWLLRCLFPFNLIFPIRLLP